MQGIFADSCTMAADERRRQTTPFPLKAGLIEQLYADVIAWQSAHRTRCIPSERGKDICERRLGHRLRKVLTRRHKDLSNYKDRSKVLCPCHKKLSAAQTALINSIPGVNVRAYSGSGVRCVKKTIWHERLVALALFQQQHHRLPKLRRATDFGPSRESSLARWLQNAKRRMAEQKLTPEQATQLLVITQISADAGSQHPVPIQCQLLFEGTVLTTTRLFCIN